MFKVDKDTQLKAGWYSVVDDKLVGPFPHKAATPPPPLTRESLEPLLIWLHWTPPGEKVDAIYENPVGHYREEKMQMLANAKLPEVWGSLDPAHQQRLLDAAKKG